VTADRAQRTKRTCVRRCYLIVDGILMIHACKHLCNRGLHKLIAVKSI